MIRANTTSAKSLRRMGFGLVELLVGLAILGVTMLAVMNAFALIQGSASSSVIAVRNISGQMLLDRLIVNQELGLGGSSSCALGNSPVEFVIYHSSSAGCSRTPPAASASELYVRAVVKPMLSGATLSSYNLSPNLLTVSTGSSSNSENARRIINALDDRSRLKIVLTQGSGPAASHFICSPGAREEASVVGNDLRLPLANCNAPGITSTAGSITLPRWYIQYMQGSGARSSRYDGVDRFLY